MWKAVQIIVVTTIIFVLIGCGGGDGDGDGGGDNNNPNNDKLLTGPSILKGTVATSNPIAAEITIVDSEGKVTTTTSNSEGKFAAEMLGTFGPYIIKIEPTDRTQPTLYSFSTGPGIANANQFTTLGLYIAKDTDLEEAFDNWATLASEWKLSDIQDAMAIINANFKDALIVNNQNPDTFDMFTVEFDADDTSDIASFLDEYAVDIDYETASYVISDSSGSTVTIDESVDISDYYIGSLFALEANTDWVVTYAYTYNGQTNTILTDFPVDSDDVPLSRAEFIEERWEDIGSQINENYNSQYGTISITTLNYEPQYSVTGDGGIGTVITTGLNFSYRIHGAVNGQPINEVTNYGWTFTYTRKS